MDRDLVADELRVLGCLVEKEASTPEQYPLSINALLQACNQKSNRDPVMVLSEADVRAAVTGLTRRGLVRQASAYGGRVNRFEHRLGRGSGSALNATPEQRALLCLLLLRGPQTAGELRSRAQRLAGPADIGAVEATLSALAGHEAGPLVERMAREAGKREARYRHCLGGADHAVPTAATTRPAGDGASSAQTLEARIAALERAVAELRARLDERSGNA